MFLRSFSIIFLGMIIARGAFASDSLNAKKKFCIDQVQYLDHELKAFEAYNELNKNLEIREHVIAAAFERTMGEVGQFQAENRGALFLLDREVLAYIAGYQMESKEKGYSGFADRVFTHRLSELGKQYPGLSEKQLSKQNYMIKFHAGRVLFTMRLPITVRFTGHLLFESTLAVIPDELRKVFSFDLAALESGSVKVGDFEVKINLSNGGFANASLSSELKQQIEENYSLSYVGIEQPYLRWGGSWLGEAAIDQLRHRKVPAACTELFASYKMNISTVDDYRALKGAAESILK